MKSMLLSDTGFWAVFGVIGVIVLTIGIALFVLSLLASIWKWVLVHRYKRFNKQNVIVGMTGSQVAQKMLEGLGLTDVKVEKAGFWSGLFFGNTYVPKTKTIRLRSNIFDKATLTSVAIASEKVAIAQRHHDGDKKIGVRAVLTKVGYFAPFSLIPLILLGVLLDYVVWNDTFSWFSIVFTVLAFAYFVASFVVVILNLKIEKKACNTALEFMQKTNVLTEDELEDAQHLYKTYITDYWIEFLYNLVFIIWETIKLICKIFSSKNRSKK